MPVFPGEVTHNNPNAKILDLTKNQVKGIGMFDTVSERNALDERMRHEGYIAIVNQQGYLFTGSDWTDESDWTAFPFRIPGGSKYSVLGKSSDSDYDYDWTNAPKFEELTIYKFSDTVGAGEIKFSSSSGAFERRTETSDGQVLGVVRFTGVAQDDSEATGGRFEFTQVGTANASGSVNSRLSIYVGTPSGDELALSVNQEKVIGLRSLESEPTPISGGLYASRSDKLYFGVA